MCPATRDGDAPLAGSHRPSGTTSLPNAVLAPLPPSGRHARLPTISKAPPTVAAITAGSLAPSFGAHAAPPTPTELSSASRLPAGRLSRARPAIAPSPPCSLVSRETSIRSRRPRSRQLRSLSSTGTPATCLLRRSRQPPPPLSLRAARPPPPNASTVSLFPRARTAARTNPCFTTSTSTDKAATPGDKRAATTRSAAPTTCVHCLTTPLRSDATPTPTPTVAPTTEPASQR